MKCPECVRNNQFSYVYPGMSIATSLGHQPFYDPTGVYHSHDPNRYATEYTCSNKHRWTESYIKPCPAEGCKYGK